MATEAQVRAFIERREALRRLMSSASDKRAERIAPIVQRLAREIMAITGRATNATDAAITGEAHVRDLLAEIDVEIKTALGRAYKEYQLAWMGAAETYAGELPQVYAVLSKPSAAVVAESFTAWQKGAARANYQKGFASWRQNFDANFGGRLRAVLQDNFRKAALDGWSQERLAREIVRSGGIFGRELGLQSVTDPKFDSRVRSLYTLGDKLPEADALIRRAQVIVRTESTHIRQRITEDFAKEAGFSKYINLNMDPVADECQAANEAGAMTWDEWADGLGIPPRHPNCDSELVPVPDDWDEDVKAEADAEALETAGEPA